MADTGILSTTYTTPATQVSTATKQTRKHTNTHHQTNPLPIDPWNRRSPHKLLENRMFLTYPSVLNTATIENHSRRKNIRHLTDVTTTAHYIQVEISHTVIDVRISLAIVFVAHNNYVAAYRHRVQSKVLVPITVVTGCGQIRGKQLALQTPSSRTRPGPYVRYTCMQSTQRTPKPLSDTHTYARIAVVQGTNESRIRCIRIRRYQMIVAHRHGLNVVRRRPRFVGNRQRLLDRPMRQPRGALKHVNLARCSQTNTSNANETNKHSLPNDAFAHTARRYVPSYDVFALLLYNAKPRPNAYSEDHELSFPPSV